MLQQSREEYQRVERSPEELAFLKLKSRQEVFSNQVEELTDRRDNLASELRQKNGADLEGAEARLKALDAQLQQAEADLNAVTKEMAAAAPASESVPDTRIIYRNFSDDDMLGAGFGGAAIMFALFLPFVIRNFFRRRRDARSRTTAQNPAIAAERVDRMEQAIDSIAVEIERVSENQRFMTRLLTETQLAGTIAAVRGSTEAARAAAEKASNV